MDTLLLDVRHALRSLAKSPAFTAVAALAMALGIGGTTALFAVFDVLLLRPLPFPNGPRLVSIYEMRPDLAHGTVSPAAFFDYQRQTPSLEKMAAYYPLRWNVATKDGPDKVLFGAVSVSFLSTLGLSPQLGRDFLPEEEFEGKEQRVLLTDGAWRRRFGADRGVIGQTLVINGRSFEVVGVLPRGFQFPAMEEAEAFVPIGFNNDDLKNRGSHFLRAFGLLKPGATVARADSDLKTVAARLAADYPGEHARVSMEATPLAIDLVGGAREPLVLGLLAMGLVLLLACANVAGMLIARGAARQHELAVRAALGGGRMRLLRQLLTEALVLGALGGALGLLLGSWALDALLTLLPPDLPRIHEVRLDPRLCAFAVAASIGAGLLAGVLPAIQSSRPGLLEALKDSGQHAAGSMRRSRLRALMVVVQIALALVLVTSAGLLARSLQRVFDVQLGLDARDVLSVQLGFPAEKFHGSRPYSQLNARVLERIAALPGVESVATTNVVPMSGLDWNNGFVIEGAPPLPPGRGLNAGMTWVSPGYRQTLRIPLLAGRDFGPSDTDQSPKVLLVNESFARRFFPGESAVGKRIRILNSRFDEGIFTWEIVGVMADVRQLGIDREPTPEFFISQTQQGFNGMTLLIRTHLPAAQMTRAVRAEILALDPQQPLGKVRWLEEVAAGSVTARRVQALVFGAAGAVGLLLAALGVYGLVAFSVAQRTREIGIRMALGAESGQVLAMVLREGMRLFAGGLALGLAGSLASSRAMQGSLYGVSALDPFTYAAVAALLAATALLASFVPARRAAQVPPMTALRAE